MVFISAVEIYDNEIYIFKKEFLSFMLIQRNL